MKCDFDPTTYKNSPIGMFHCPNCGKMIVGGIPHPEYDDYDYSMDEYGIECLLLAKQCKTDVGFGAVLVKNGKVVGSGRNRRATNKDRKSLTHVGYAIHAEQSAILDALDKGVDVRDCSVYALGICLKGKEKGRLTTRTERIFVCSKCPHTFVKYNVSVFIPHVSGWMKISPEESLEIGKRVANKGYWKDFCNKK